MKRLMGLLGAVLAAAGCQSPNQNPQGAFGPATIPPPNIQMPGDGSYYVAPPAAAGAAASGLSPTTPGFTAPAFNAPAFSAPTITMPPANSLPSISVPTGGAPRTGPPRPYSFGSLAPQTGATIGRTASTSSFATDPADREPIRIVEAAPGSSTANRSFPTRTSAAPSIVEASPAVREPIRAFGAPAEVSRLPGPSSGSFGTSPTPNRAPGVIPAQPQSPGFGQPPASGIRSSGSYRTDHSVAPAGYQPGAAGFYESPATDASQWRSR